MNSRLRQGSAQAFEKSRAFADSPQAGWLLALWSFSEALLWFILPDFLLLILAMLASNRIRRWVMLSVVFSVLGSAVMCLLVFHWTEAMRRTIFYLPYTAPCMVAKVQQLAQAHGLWAVLWQPFSAVPVKVWTVMAIEQFHWPVTPYLILLGLSRGFRMLLVAGLGVLLMRHFAAWLKRYWLLWLAVYTCLFLGLLQASVCKSFSQ